MSAKKFVQKMNYSIGILKFSYRKTCLRDFEKKKSMVKRFCCWAKDKKRWVGSLYQP